MWIIEPADQRKRRQSPSIPQPPWAVLESCLAFVLSICKLHQEIHSEGCSTNAGNKQIKIRPAAFRRCGLSLFPLQDFKAKNAFCTKARLSYALGHSQSCVIREEDSSTVLITEYENCPLVPFNTTAVKLYCSITLTFVTPPPNKARCTGCSLYCRHTNKSPFLNFKFQYR